MRNRVVVISAVMLVASLLPRGVSASPECLAYEPSSVELRGTVVREAFPGPPNYESVADGDATETYWFLQLATPVCVAAKPSDALYPPASGVMRVQLVLQPAQYERFAALLGAKASVSGRLFASHTGHHHTPVLMTVAKMKQLGQK